MKTRNFALNLNLVLLGLCVFSSACDARGGSAPSKTYPNPADNPTKKPTENPTTNPSPTDPIPAEDLRPEFELGDFAYRVKSLSAAERIARTDARFSDSIDQTQLGLCEFIRLNANPGQALPGEYPRSPSARAAKTMRYSLAGVSGQLSVEVSEMQLVTVEVDVYDLERRAQQDATAGGFLYSDSRTCLIPTSWKVSSLEINVESRMGTVAPGSACHRHLSRECVEETAQLGGLVSIKRGSSFDPMPIASLQWAMRAPQTLSAADQTIVRKGLGLSEATPLTGEFLIEALRGVAISPIRALAITDEHAPQVNLWALVNPLSAARDEGNRRGDRRLVPFAPPALKKISVPVTGDLATYAEAIDAGQMLGSNFFEAWDALKGKPATSTVSHRAPYRLVGDAFHTAIRDAVAQGTGLTVHLVWALPAAPGADALMHTQVKVDARGVLGTPLTTRLNHASDLNLPNELLEY